MDRINEDFEALGLGEEAVVGTTGEEEDDDCMPWGAPLALEREAPVYRSVSQVLLGESELDEPVYRSVCVAPSSLYGGSRSFGGSALDLDAEALEFGVQDKIAAKAEWELTSTGRLERPMAAYCPAPVHAFSELRGADLVLRLKEGLRAASIDFHAFDAQSGSFACKSQGCRFDLYALELLPADRAAHGSSIIEVQRLSSGSRGNWAALVNRLMEALAPLCTAAGYYAAGQTPASRSCLAPLPLFAADDEDDEDEIPIEEEALVREYANMVAMLCARETSYENKVQLAQLLFEMSTEKQAAETLLRARALPALIELLQAELLHGRVSGDLNCAVCAVLANLAELATDSADRGAFVTMEVLRNGSSDKLEVEQLRQAARALACFSKRVHAKSELLPQIRQVVVNRCSRQPDEVLAAHSSAVLRNLSVGA